MTRSVFNLCLTVLFGWMLVGPTVRAAATNETPDFNEVYDLLRANLPGISEADLNRAAVLGLFENLRGKVSLVEEQGGAASSPTGQLIRATVIEDNVAYARVKQVGSELAEELSRAIENLSATNQLKGLVLDLRFSEGSDFASAVAVADLFVAKERPLLDWGDGMVKSKEKANAIRLPVAVLVNRETVGATEALAAMLRDAGAGLILGRPTAGGAMMTREFTLKTGQRLRVASTPIKLGNGAAIPASGLQPDIEVTVNSRDERVYFEDPYAMLPRTNVALTAGLMVATEGTNRPVRRPRISEADLVRERREGTNFNVDEFMTAREREPEKPLIRDPALARAVDLLKGLALVRRTRS